MEAVAFLPSGGRVYKDVNPEDIVVRTMKGKDEKLLAEMNYDNIEKKYAILLNALVTGIDAKDLTLGDRASIILWIRANSFSSTLPTTFICSECFQKVSTDIDLTKVELKELADDFVEPCEITLSDDTQIKLRLFRVQDELKISEWEKKTSVAEAYLYRWALSIVEDDDIPTRIAKLSNMEARDLLKIKSFHKANLHGPELDKVPYLCPKCGSEGVLTLPFRPDFLIPSEDEY